MARVADYVILQDDFFRIVNGVQGQSNHPAQTFDFNMPPGFHAASRSILMFVMQLKTSNVEFRIFLNDQVTLFHAIISEDNQWHSFHKVIPANSLKQSSSNKLKFALDGNGVVDFSDVVILCQANT